MLSMLSIYGPMLSFSLCSPNFSWLSKICHYASEACMHHTFEELSTTPWLPLLQVLLAIGNNTSSIYRER